MPKRDAAPIWAPSWVDIMTSDIERTRSFYCDLFGWEAEEPNQELGGYFNFSKDGIRVAGGLPTMPEAQGQPDVWSVYLAVEDAEAIVAKAEKAGAHVIAPVLAIGALGSMAVVSDPGGAVIGMWQAGTHKGFEIFDEPDTPSYAELHTRSYEQSIPFYQEVFGWETETAADEPQFRYTTLGKGDDALAGIMDASGFLPEGVPAHWSVYFRVADADATAANAQELGAKVVQGPDDTPYGRLVVLSDPTGAEFRLIGPNNG